MNDRPPNDVYTFRNSRNPYSRSIGMLPFLEDISVLSFSIGSVRKWSRTPESKTCIMPSTRSNKMSSDKIIE